jgi:hypothetical protein
LPGHAVACEFAPGDQSHPHSSLGFLAAAHDERRSLRVGAHGEIVFPPLDWCDPITCEGPARLHFDEDEAVITLNDKIDLPPPLVPEKLQRNAAGLIEPTLEDLGRDRGLKDRTSRYMGDRG